MDPLFSPEEIVRLTGGLRQPAAQLRELKNQGFYRARRSRVTGEVLLEREHYAAVSRGSTLGEDAAIQEPEILA